MMRPILILLLAALALPASADTPATTATPVKVTPQMAQAMDLRTATLQRQTWRSSWTAYGRVVSGAALASAARTLVAAQQTQAAAQASASASGAEYRRLEGLYARHANVSRRQLEAARAQRQSDRAALQKARAGLAEAKGTVEATWGPVIADWLTDPRQLGPLTAGRTRLVRLTLPGHTRIADPGTPVTLVTIDGARIPAHWVSAAPASGDGLQGAAFYVRTTRDTDRLAYGSGVVGHVPHGPARHGVIVPRSAVVWSGAAAWVFVRSGKGTYRREPVSTRHPAGGGWFEPRTPAPGAVVVTRGAQVLLSIQQQAGAPPSASDDDDD